MTPKWFRLLKRQTTLGEYHPDLPSKHGKVTHLHGSKIRPKEKVMREGLKPKGKYRKFYGGYTKDRFGPLGVKLSGKPKPLIWTTDLEQELPEEYASMKTIEEGEIDYSSIFDSEGKLLPKPKLPEKKVVVSENLIGIRGEDINWDKSTSPIYRQGDKFYITDKEITPDKLIFMSVDKWKKYLQKD